LTSEPRDCPRRLVGRKSGERRQRTQHRLASWRIAADVSVSAFYVVGYLSFSVPAILTGLVAPLAGLPPAAGVHGAVVIVLALGSLLAMLRSD
jgi:hypothetical protein